MFCTKCGAEYVSGKFCSRCGAAFQEKKAVEQKKEQEQSPEVTELLPEATEMSPEQQLKAPPDQINEPVPDTCSAKKSPAGRKKRTIIIIICIAAALIILGSVAGVIVYSNTGERLVEKQLSLGEKYLTEMKYDAAIVAFNKVIDVDPKNVDAYIGLADAYTGKQEPEKVVEVLDTGLWEVPNSNIIEKKLLDSLLILAEVYLNDEQYDEALEAYQDALELSPDNEDALLGIEYALIGLGDPNANNADVSFVTTDVSDYPYVRVYCRILDTATGESVNNLTADSFVLMEKLEGGEYLSREVHSVEQLEGNAGLNIALVADKSDSISYDSMSQIKYVMTEFVSDLDYTVGDKAELLAFDTEVTQMCIFTGDSSRLLNGINNMYTDGCTALYDALREAVNHVRFQDGANCVIAFTDGLDNESLFSPNDVVSLASQYEVPIYIIGVGSEVDEYTLSDIANQTGGQYWYIDDLKDMNEIYNTIYKEQKEMYIIEYETDASADEYANRELSVSFKGVGYMEECEVDFAPKTPVAGDTDLNLQANAASTSRYQLFVSNMSWEQAADYCIALGGHLVTIESANEEQTVESMAEQAGVSFVWLGGYTSYDDMGSMFGHWVTGEPFSYTKWTTGEPSKDDLDGTAERYIVLWNVVEYGGWSWNDTRNDPVAEGHYTDKLAFVCEFES